MAKNYWRLVMTKFWAPKPPFFCIKEKNLYIQNVGHIWAYIYADSQDFWKSFNVSGKTKCVKKCGKKCQQIIFKTPFWSSSKNQRLDVKVCADPSWLLVFKYGFKKCCSLKNYWVLMFEVNVKNVTEKKGRGPARVWGFDNKPSLTQVIFLMKHIFLEVEAMTDLCILSDPKI